MDQAGMDRNHRTEPIYLIARKAEINRPSEKEGAVSCSALFFINKWEGDN